MTGKEKYPAKGTVYLLNRIFNGSLLVTAVSSGVLILFIMIVMVIHVAGRYLFTAPIPWSIEFSEYFLAISVFLGAAWVLKEEAHVTIDFLLVHLSSRNRALMNAITSWTIAFFLLIITYWGVVVTYRHFLTREVLWKTVLTPIWILDIFVPIATLLLFIQCLKRARGYWQSARK